MSDVRLNAVRKSFGTVDVIKAANLEIRSGEFVVFVGPSGCGKSTLLRMIAGLEQISSGEIEIGGVVVNDMEPARRGIAMVFQSYALYPHMTVRENMGFALRFAGVPKAEIAKQVSEAARILELEPLLDRKPRQLSGGQRQRVAIGRAIVRHPKVFLFDEPLSNLDAELRVHMRIEIARLHKELNATIIYVTHDQVEAMTLADRIVVLRAGTIEQVGTPLELYDDPDNVFVAGFIGSPRINLLKGVVEAPGAAGTRVRLPEFGASVVSLPDLSAALPAGAPVTLGVRPEHFGEAGAGELQLTVELVEYLGAETFAYARHNQGEVITVGLGNRRNIAAGHALTARFDPVAALLFDPEGRRVR